MTGWDELVSAALLGTDRRAAALDGLAAEVRAQLRAVRAAGSTAGVGRNFSSSGDEKLHRQTGSAEDSELLRDDEDPARVLLDAAALSVAYRRAGRRPLRDVEPLPAARAEGRPVPRDAAIRRLAAMLSGEHATVLAEWLRVVGERGWAVPAEFLPALADLARGRTELRPAIAAAAGPRAAWLARLNPDWSFLADHADTPGTAAGASASPAVGAMAGAGGGLVAGGNADAPAGPAAGTRAVAGAALVAGGDEIWLHGTGAERRRWLVAVRRADPDAAREALAGTWGSEPAAVRAELLPVLADGLGMADEEFCERALDDRAVEVRRVAAGLLAALPGSRYGERMAERVLACLSVRRRPRQGVVLMVALPEECDDAMRRDGIDPRPRQAGALLGEAGAAIGERAWWFAQLIAAAPLSALATLAASTLAAPGNAAPDDGAPGEADSGGWGHTAGRELGERAAEVLLGMAVEGVDAGVLRAAVAAAVVREKDAGWARVMLRTDPVAGQRTDELVAVLPKGEWAVAVAGVREVVDPADIVGRLPQPWPAGLGTMLLDVLAAATPDRSWARLASVAARSVPPEVLDHPLSWEPAGEEDTWRRRLVETLVFRREMYEELS